MKKKSLLFRGVLIVFIVFFLASSLSGFAFALDTEGCLVCHGDKELARDKKSLYIDSGAYEKSVHKDLLCSNCHLGFTITLPHQPVTGESTRIAAIACKNCHVKYYGEYRIGIHGREFLMGNTKSAACGDCHGSHYIKSLKDEKVRKEFWASADKVCGKCHEEEWENYGDYYHGQAYKVGFEKAPTCWECHDYHKILPPTYVDSSISPENLHVTCGKCHPGSTKGFADGYGPMIHGVQGYFKENIILRWLRSIFSWFPW